jgi:hypothetical protein
VTHSRAERGDNLPLIDETTPGQAIGGESGDFRAYSVRMMRVGDNGQVCDAHRATTDARIEPLRPTRL